MTSRVVRGVRPVVLLLLWVPLLAIGASDAGGAESAEEEGTLAKADVTVTRSEEEALAKTVQNPIAALVSVPFQYNYNGGVGEFDRKALNLNVQPIIPFPGDKWNVISRTIIPLNSIPVGETGSIFGPGDLHIALFLSPAKAGALTWGLGLDTYLPTAANAEVLGTGKLSIGPTGVLFFLAGRWTMGGVASNAWSVAGDSDREDVNFFFAQYFLNFNFGAGWALGTAPIITCDWTAESGQQWIVPFGLQLSKVTHLGNRPANLLAGYYQNVEHPTGGPESQVRLQVNLLYPSKR